MSLAARLRALADAHEARARDLREAAALPAGPERAVLSPCGLFRYALRRELGILAPERRGSVLWVMLNPSTADASQDDPTIRRCLRFSRDWGYGSMAVANLYAFRSPKPWALRYAPDHDEAENDAWIKRLSAEAGIVVAAWGANAERARARTVLELLARPVDCLGLTRNGHPRHPLYIPAATCPMRYEWSVE